jgi:hypothetical protein
VRDLALIGAAQQVEHHEIAVYGTLARWAEILGLSSDLWVLKSIEAEESKADELLTEIASTLNMKAGARRRGILYSSSHAEVLAGCPTRGGFTGGPGRRWVRDILPR